MEKDQKMNELHSGLAILLSGFSHLAACGGPFKEIQVKHIQLTLINKPTGS